MNRIKVLHLITHLGVGGALDNTLLTVERLPRDRYQVDLAAGPLEPGYPSWEQRSREAADSLFLVPELQRRVHPLHDLRAARWLAAFLRDQKYDVVHTHCSKAGVLGRHAARRIQTPVILHTCHAFGSQVVRSSSASPLRRFVGSVSGRVYGAAERYASRHSDRILTVCERNRQQAIEARLAPADKLITVYSGIDRSRFRSEREPAEVRRSLGLETSRPLIGFIGRLAEQKAPLDFVAAARRVLQTRPDTRFVIAGDGPLREQVLAAIGGDPRITFIGHCHEIPELLSGLDALAVSSRWEGLGRSVTEAMMMGIPVAATAVDGIPELIQHGHTGLLSASGDSDGLANNLLRLLNDPAKARVMAAAGQDCIGPKFDADHMVRHIDQVYQNLLWNKGYDLPAATLPHAVDAATGAPSAEAPTRISTNEPNSPASARVVPLESTQPNRHKMERQTKLSQSDPVAKVTRRASKRGLRLAYLKQLVFTAAPLLATDLLVGGTVTFLLSLVAHVADMEAWPAWGPASLLVAIGLASVFATFGLYPGVGLHPVAEMRKIALAGVIFFGTLALVSVAALGSLSMVPWLGLGFLLILGLSPALRVLARRLASRQAWWGQPLLVFGDDEVACRLFRFYRSAAQLGWRPIQVPDDWLTGKADNGRATERIRSEQLRSLRNEHQSFWAVFSSPLEKASSALIEDYLTVFPQTLLVVGGERFPNTASNSYDCGNFSGVLVSNHFLQPIPRLFKRASDCLFVVLAMIFWIPLMIGLAALVKLTSPGPVFYAQKRVGRGSQAFWAWKFRTMNVDADAILEQCLRDDPKLREEWNRDHKLKNDPRVTFIGHFLRKTSLDELPQLWNVLRGEMSLVGPRPIVSEEISKYGEAFGTYSRTLPGITGLWQVSGRNNTRYEERVTFDTYYVRNWSPWLDLYILWRSIKVVLLREGAY